MKAGDLVRAKQYFDGVALVVKNPSVGMFEWRILVQITRNGNRMWMNKKELEVINESR